MPLPLTAADDSKNCEALTGGEVFGEKTAEECLPEKLCHVAYFQPAHQIEAMHFNRSNADGQPAGNITIRLALRNQLENFLLTRRQPPCFS